MPQSSDDILRIIHNTNDPTIEDILQLLQQRSAMPTFQVDPTRGADAAYSPYNNTVKLGPYGGTTATVAHELTHALDNKMSADATSYTGYGHQYFPTDSQQQFADAYQKLDPSTSKVPYDPSKFSDSYLKYRINNPDERRAWGVGNMNIKGNSPEDAGSHNDATMATEAAILRELYQRQMNDPKRGLSDLIMSLFNK